MVNSTIVLSFHNSLLHQSDVALLGGPYWLNDTVISFYFEYLEKVLFRNAKDVLFASPEVTQCIKMVQPDEINIFLEPLDIHNKMLVFFALNNNDSPDEAGGSHWSLLVFSRNENCIYHLDSLSGTNQYAAGVFKSHIMSYLSKGGTINFVEKECSQQTNGYDCGVHLICNTERIARHAQNCGNINSCDMSFKINPNIKRKEILAIIHELSNSH